MFLLDTNVLSNARKKKASKYLTRLVKSEIMPAFEGRIIPVTTDIALNFAALHVPDKQPANDALIAATAKVKGLTVVTRNDQDFQFDGTPKWGNADNRLGCRETAIKPTLKHLTDHHWQKNLVYQCLMRPNR